MTKKKSDQDDPDLKAIVEWEPTPDAEARWAAALDMLLEEPPPESEGIAREEQQTSF